MTPRPHSPAAVRGWGTDQGEGRVWSVGRRRTAQSASRPSRASGASYSGDEEPSGHPAQIAAAAGRLHCLTITRAGFSPRILRLLLPFSHCGPCLFLWNVLGVLTSVTVPLEVKNLSTTGAFATGFCMRSLRSGHPVHLHPPGKCQHGKKRPANPRDTYLEERAPSSRSQKETARATAVQGGSQGRTDTPGPVVLASGEAPI
ncbi:uncharacterized protein LOC129630309 isoform X1 [Bubalus kerabau]|uniref:uncharacterized protein LOC129630309 isoform X1 n=1 Tax=Bubalus carabanensis TaxID=3119969 RepID=UPI00244E685E|nr:uncharacterized protein LOC129630309 isoform X1 [Bubalus carabanensis]